MKRWAVILLAIILGRGEALGGGCANGGFGCAPPPLINSPPPGSNIPDSTIPFVWTATSSGPDVVVWYIDEVSFDGSWGHVAGSFTTRDDVCVTTKIDNGDLDCDTVGVDWKGFNVDGRIVYHRVMAATAPTDAGPFHYGLPNVGNWFVVNGPVSVPSLGTMVSPINYAVVPDGINVPITLQWTIGRGQLRAKFTVDRLIQLNRLDPGTWIPATAGTVDVTDGSSSFGPNIPAAGVYLPTNVFKDDGSTYRWAYTPTNALGDGPTSAYGYFVNGPAPGVLPDPPDIINPGIGSIIPKSDNGCFQLEFSQSDHSYDFVARLFEGTAYNDPSSELEEYPMNRIWDQDVGTVQICLLPVLGRLFTLDVLGRSSVGTNPSIPVSFTNDSGERCSHIAVGSGFGPQGQFFDKVISCYDEETRFYRLINKAERIDHYSKPPLDLHGKLAVTAATQDQAGISTIIDNPNTDSLWDSIATSQDNTWGGGGNTAGQDAVAVHVHTGLMYEFLRHHQLNSFDDKGTSMQSSVDVPTEVGDPNNPNMICPFQENADADGQTVAYGVVGSHGWRIANSADVTSHETCHNFLDDYTHINGPGLTGAIHESFGDLCQAGFDDYIGQGNPWIVGDDIYPPGVVFRDMGNPLNPGSLGRPEADTYLGQNWFNVNGCVPFFSSCTQPFPVGNNDGCGVHFNAGVLNKLWYLLAQGGTHNGVTVTGIGLKPTVSTGITAARFFWGLHGPTMDFSDAVGGLIAAAQKNYGPSSPQVAAVIAAAQAVKIPIPGVIPGPKPTPSPPPCTGDCSGDHQVTINELISMVNVVLGLSPESSCQNDDPDGSGTTTINEVIAAVSNSLNGCPTAASIAAAVDAGVSKSGAGVTSAFVDSTPVQLSMNEISGFSGDQVTFRLTLELGDSVAGLAFNLALPSALSNLQCTLDPRLNNTNFGVSQNTVGSTTEVVISNNLGQLLTWGALAECSVSINVGTQPGFYPIDLTNGQASDGNGNLLTLVFRKGGVFVDSLTPLPGPSVSGQITYYSSARPVGNVVMSLTGGPALLQQLSGTNGVFALSGATAGDDYHLTPSKPEDFQLGISALDAAWILQYVAGKRSFTPEQKLAGDVTGNGTVSSLDAARIMQFVVERIATFPTATVCGSDWLFIPADPLMPDAYKVPPLVYNSRCQPGHDIYSPLSFSVVGQNFTAILLGDVTGNWQPATAAAAHAFFVTDGPTVQTRRPRPAPGSTLVAPAKLIALPVKVRTRQKFQAVDLSLAYDAATLQPQSVATHGIALEQASTDFFSPEPGVVNISLANGDPVYAAGTTMYVYFVYTGENWRDATVQLVSADVDENPATVISWPNR